MVQDTGALLLLVPLGCLLHQKVLHYTFFSLYLFLLTRYSSGQSESSCSISFKARLDGVWTV